MNEVFGKKPVTSREFPVLLFSACSNLFHLSPDWEVFCRLRLHANGVDRDEQECQRASVIATRKLVALFEETTAVVGALQLPERLWLESYLGALRLSEDQIKSFTKDILERRFTDLKWTFSQTVIDVLSALRDRGYRMGVVSNWRGALSEILRVQGLLEFFDVVMTSFDAGMKTKPDPEIFRMALSDLDESENRGVVIGDHYATDILGAQRAGLAAVLYDPLSTQLRALQLEDTSGKIVDLESLKHNRRLENVKVIQHFEELLEFFR